MSSDDIRRYTSEIVTSYLRHHDVAQEHVPEVIAIVHTTLTKLTQPDVVLSAPETPAISIRRSVTDDYIICLDCGFRGKMIRRHLRMHGLTPDQYRKRWNLPSDYPMVAPGYSETRSELAKSIGLGRFSRTRLPNGKSEPSAGG